MPLVEERGFSFDLDLLRSKLTDRTKMVILNSPQNPTGGVIPREDIAAIAELVRDRDMMVLSDEIYSRISYGETPVSIASFPGMLEKTIILDGFSKIYAMTGWRMGYGVMPDVAGGRGEQADGELELVHGEFHQRAGIAALTGRRMVRGDGGGVPPPAGRVRRRSEHAPGFRCPMPEGAFYAFPNITGTGLSSKELADRLLNEAGVACLSGTSFGEYGEGYLRFSYANSLENLMEAVRRMGEWLKQKSQSTVMKP